MKHPIAAVQALACGRAAPTSALKPGMPEANEPYRRTRHCRAPAGFAVYQGFVTLVSVRLQRKFHNGLEMTVIPVPLDEGGTRHDNCAR